MTRRLNPRHRRTFLGRDVGRPAGFYEQCDHRSSCDLSSLPRPGAHLGSLAAFGLVGRPGGVGHHVLRALAGSDRVSDFDARTISIADLLSEVRLDADADLIMWRGADGAQVATSIALLLEDDAGALLLGGSDLTASPRWSAPVILRSACLPHGSDMNVVALTAMTFVDFVGGAR